MSADVHRRDFIGMAAVAAGSWVSGAGLAKAKAERVELLSTRTITH